MKLTKKIFALSLCAAAILCFAGVAFAEGPAAIEVPYVKADGAPPRPTAQASIMDAQQSPYASQVALLRDAMKDRVPNVKIEFHGISLPYADPREQSDPTFDDGIYDIVDFFNDIYALALEHTGAPNEGDYIWRHMAGYGGSMSPLKVDAGGNITDAEFTYKCEYHTTAAQELMVDEAVEGLLAGELNPEGRSEIEIIQAIYDWICSNVSYDYEHMNDESYEPQFTVYAALYDKKAVCQGYATLFYRLALESGVDCRYISGIGNGGRHGWNIVKLGDVYYFVDSTWDSEYSAKGSAYRYFLRCAKDMEDHSPDVQFDAQFWAEHPLTRYCYGGAPVTAVRVSQAELSLEAGASAEVTATVEPASAYCTNVVWSSDNAAAASVDGGRITAVAPGSAEISAVAAGGAKGVVKVTVSAAPEKDGDYTLDLGSTEVPADGGAFYAEVSVKKETDRPGGDVVVLSLVDAEGRTVGLAYMKIDMAAGQTATFGTEFNAAKGCRIEARVCESLTDPTLLGAAVER